MERNPVWATTLGDHRFDDRLDDPSWRSLALDRLARRRWLLEAQAIDAAGLDADDRVTLRLFTADLQHDVDAEVCAVETWLVSTSSNPIATWNYLPEEHHLETVADGRHLVDRVRAIPAWIDADIETVRRGVKEGRVENAATLRLVIAQADAQLAQPLGQWPLMAPLLKLPASWSADDRAAFTHDLTAAVQTGVKPAYARWRAFVNDELLPHGRDDDHVGLASLPDGAACYAARLHGYTSLDDVTPDQLHALGLSEIARIDTEIATLGGKLFAAPGAVGAQPDLAAVLAHLRSDDPALYFKDEDEIEATAKANLARARAAIPQWFGLLPKTEVIVRRVPDYEAPYSTIAYYRPPHPDGTKPGEYFVNVLAPTTRPRFEAEPLAFHESIPGHHLQIAIAQELPALPTFRKHLETTAFVEGWALYAERLADEMGLYSGDAARLGMLDYEAWRAARLVVDTGLHAKGWSRAQAVEFMRTHTALAFNNIDNEVDRYINDPGQAVAYKVGQLTILRLRDEARQRMGAKFDIKKFHDVVLGAGAVSLPVLEDRVKAWIAATSR